MKHKRTKLQNVTQLLQKRADCLRNLPLSNLQAFVNRLQWLKAARPQQITPQGNWRVWLVMAGRGWGKTRTGAEDIAHYALWNDNIRAAVIAPTYADARDTCVEGESGLLRVLPPSCVAKWNRSLGELVLTNGSRIKLFSADRPERLRGPQHHRAWCDELGAWNDREAFDQLWFGLRLGKDPRVIVTTTPRNTDMLRDLFKRQSDDVHLTRGRTADNAENLSPHVMEQLTERYGGTRLGRQELDAELLTDTENALWKRDQIDTCRVSSVPELRRIVVAIDPALSHGVDADETGIIAAARGADGLLYVLSDWSGRYAPDAWAERAVMLYTDMRAQMIVAEVNAGGELVEKILRQKAPHVLFKPVRALRNKVERALPVAALYEQGRVRHVGNLNLLEDQMCRFTTDGTMSPSPDRVDALVWALTELSETSRGEPRIRSL
ncbi:MAG: DNA-packaging protein [Alphaproteobacteria bacterium]|nr:DNA-packaging protein [Alphaproteobacteria bacterium]